MKIVIVGAGSIVFTRKLLSDLLAYEEFKNVEVALVDIDTEILEVSYRMARQLNTDKKSDAIIGKYSDMRDALEGADYVINTVQIGGEEATRVDFDIPEKYGLKQTIGDTHGVGGVFRFLRTAPFLSKLVDNIEELCPDALLINFTNPMSLCMWYITSISNVRCIGLCHSVPSTMKTVSKYVGVPLEEVAYTIAGINHMAWILEFRRGKEDLYPRLREAMTDQETFMKDPVRFEIMKRFDYFVTESSEHMSEYVPYFLRGGDSIRDFNIPVREYLRRLEVHAEVYELYRAYYIDGDISARLNGEANYGKYFGVLNDNDTPEELTREYAIDIIHSIEYGISRTIYAIVPNNGSIANLPQDSVVEVPCLVDGNGVQPTTIGEIPYQLAALNMNQIQVQRLAVESVLCSDFNMVKHAMLLDPLASAVLTPEQIVDMTDDLRKAHSEYIEELF